MKFRIEQIAEVLTGEIEGDLDAEVWTLSKIEEAQKGSITFLANPKYKEYIYTTKATLIIVNKDFVVEEPITTNLIRVDDAYKAFTDLLHYYQQFKQQNKKGIDTNSHIGENVKYGENLYLGTYAYIGDNVTIGNDVKIYPQAYIGDNVVIGDGVIIYSGAKIYEDIQIGHHCIINSGCVLGTDGFGFVPDENNVYSKVPQLGNVILEDDVDLGACVTIDRATLGSTIIKKGVKLDNQVHIAHNVVVENNTVIAAQVGIAGSSKVGKCCVIGGQVGIAGHIKIADKVKIQAQSGVVKETKEGDALQGSPAFNYRDYNKAYVYFKKLPTLIHEIEKKMNL